MPGFMMTKVFITYGYELFAEYKKFSH